MFRLRLAKKPYRVGRQGWLQGSSVVTRMTYFTAIFLVAVAFFIFSFRGIVMRNSPSW